MSALSNPLSRRQSALTTEAQRYAWWLGKRSVFIRKLIALSGWRLSRRLLRLCGRPPGALNWPLGLAFLFLNASPAKVRPNLAWVERAFSGLIDEQGELLLQTLHIDMSGLAYAALRLYELRENPKYLNFANKLAQQLFEQQGADNGMIPYTMGRTEVLIDTVGFICPFLARLSRISGNDQHAGLALRQLETFLHHSVGKTSDWPAHAFDARNLKRIGLRGWGRGSAWLLLGITDTLMELPPGPAQDKLIQLADAWLQKFAGAQRPDGHWSWYLEMPSATLDSSVTALVYYCLERLIKADYPEFKKYFPLLDSCRKAIHGVSLKTGHVAHASGEAFGIGLYNSGTGNYLWALGPVAAAELLAHN
ncbi:MAG: glycoside hydrolase family 88 protein [Pseudomonadota bacterium]